jgi:internalin A
VGISEKGERTGEIDIKIDDEENNTISLCEAFNLEYCNKVVISSHLIKIFNYDVNGLERNFIIVYAGTKNYLALWEKYLNSIRVIKYPYELINNIDDVSRKHSRFSDIKVGLSLHKRNESITELYHIFVNMNFVR